MIFYQGEIIPLGSVTDPELATNRQETYVLSSRHMPVPPIGLITSALPVHGYVTNWIWCLSWHLGYGYV